MDETEEEEYFLSKSFYGKSKLGEDFLIIATIFKDEDVEISFNVRSKEPAIGNMIMKKIKDIDFGTALSQEEEEDK